MNIYNSIFIKKIDNIVKLSDQFDTLFASIIDNSSVKSSSLVENIFKLTNIYMSLRSEHGLLIVLFEKYKNDVEKNIKIDSDNITSNSNQLYDLSTFDSVIKSISDLISNIDFQFKKIAIMFPKFITSKPITLILLVKDIDQNNKYVKIFNQLNKTNPEYIYKIIKCNTKEKVNCGINKDGKKININVEKLPSMYILNNNISEIPIDMIESEKSLLQLID